MKIAGKNLTGCAAFAIIGAVGLFFLFFVAIAVAMFYYDTRDTAYEHQEALNAQYSDNQNRLSEYISSFYEQVGIADRQTDALDEILQDAIRGRYDDGEGGVVSRGTLAAAITEAYPDLDLSIYERILDFIQEKRTEFRESQTLMLDRIRAFNQWRTTGRFLGQYFRSRYPDDRLVARTGDEELFGIDALRKMGELVLTGQAVEAFDSGEMDPLTLPPRGGGE